MGGGVRGFGYNEYGETRQDERLRRCFFFLVVLA